MIDINDNRAGVARPLRLRSPSSRYWPLSTQPNAVGLANAALPNRVANSAWRSRMWTHISGQKIASAVAPAIAKARARREKNRIIQYSAWPGARG